MFGRISVLGGCAGWLWMMAAGSLPSCGQIGASHANRIPAKPVHVTAAASADPGLTVPHTLTTVVVTWAPPGGAKEAATGVAPSGSTGVQAGVPFHDDEVLASSGLQIGTQVTEEDFRRAIRQLSSTGVFRELNYSFRYTPDTVDLTLELAPAEHFLPVHFDNFVWLDEPALRAELHTRVPLFSGKVPESGEILDQIAAALDWLLRERGIAGHADYLLVAEEGKPVSSVVYTIGQTSILVAAMHFPGADPDREPELELSAKRWVGQNYQRGILAGFAASELTDLYYRQGFLRVKFGDPTVKVLTAGTASSGAEPATTTQVEVILPVDEGKPFRLGEVAWSGNLAVLKEKLQGLISLRSGEAANDPLLRQQVQKVQRLYEGRGFMKATATVESQIDDPRGVVDYTVKIVEGAQYRMGSLDVEGLDQKASGRVQELWRLREGDVFSMDALEHLPTPTAIGLAGAYEWSCKTEVGLDEVSHTVDVTLRYEPRSPRDAAR